MQNRKGKKNAAQLLDPLFYSKIATTMLQKDYRDRMEGDTPELYRLERMSRKMGVTRQTFYRYLSQDTAKPQLDLFVRYAQAIDIMPSQFFWTLTGLFYQAEETERNRKENKE